MHDTGKLLHNQSGFWIFPASGQCFLFPDPDYLKTDAIMCYLLILANLPARKERRKAAPPVRMMQAPAVRFQV